jgi:hypothetical protein
MTEKTEKKVVYILGGIWIAAALTLFALEIGNPVKIIAQKNNEHKVCVEEFKKMGVIKQCSTIKATMYSKKDSMRDKLSCICQDKDNPTYIYSSVVEDLMRIWVWYPANS